MKRSAKLMALPALMLMTCALLSPPPAAYAGPTVALLQDEKKEEADAYKAWYDANAAKDYPKAMALAKTYLEKYPSGENAGYLKTWVVQVRGYLFNQAMQSKNTAEMIRLGKEALADDPNSLDYLYLLAVNIRANEISKAPPNFSYAAACAEYTQKSIGLIESGKVPAVVEQAKWNQRTALAYLYHSLAIIEEHNKNTDKALAHYRKAADLDPTTPAYFLACGSLHQTKYVSAVQKYQAFPEEDRTAEEPKAEVKAALDEVNKQADSVIDCWARFMALTAEKNPYGDTRARIEKALTDLYNYRHPETPEGLQELIRQFRTSAPPAGNGETTARQP